MPTHDPWTRVDEIALYLKARKGAVNAVPLSRMAKDLNLADDATCSRTRQVIREELLENRRIPVGSSTKGFFIIKDQDEAATYVRSLYSRSQEIDNRAALVWKAFEKAA